MAVTALTDIHKSKCYVILGIPEDGASIVVEAMSHIPPSLVTSFQSTHWTGDHSTLITAIAARFTAIDNSEQATRLVDVLTEWDNITPGGVTKITQTAGGTTGVIVDYEKQRERIRQEVGEILGVAVPRGGFWKESLDKFSAVGKGDR